MYMASTRIIRPLSTMLVVLICLATAGVACSNETDTTLTSQQESIQKYLEGAHQPRLIPEAELGSSLDDQPQYYTQWGLDIFRYISTMYAEGRDSLPVAENGDILSITYTAYIFTGNAPAIANMYATNDSASIEQLQQAGLNTEYEWTTDPYEFMLGNGDVLNSLDIALEGCHKGDSVEVYLTFEGGYGNNYIGKVPSKSSVVWFITINDIKK